MDGWRVGWDIVLMGGQVGTVDVPLTFSCLFCRMVQEVRKVAIWWIFMGKSLPE